MLKYFGKEETAMIMEVFRRVGRGTFSYSDVSDLMPDYMQLRRMKGSGIIELVRRRHHCVPTAWRFVPELAYRMENAIRGEQT